MSERRSVASEQKKALKGTPICLGGITPRRQLTASRQDSPRGSGAHSTITSPERHKGATSCLGGW